MFARINQDKETPQLAVLFLCITLTNIIVVAVSAGSSLSDQVYQTPRALFSNPGENVKLECSHSILSYNRILWYKQPKNGHLQLLGYMYLQKDYPESVEHVKMEGSAVTGKTCTLTIDKLTLNSSAVYFCAARDRGNYDEAYFGAGTKLTVLEPGHDITPPQRVSVLKPKGCTNNTVTLVCVASGFYPDHVIVSWKINQVKDTKNVATDAIALREGKYYSITSRLKVAADMWFTSSNKFTCVVDFFNGTATTPYNKSVYSEEGIRSITQDKYMRVMQMAKLSYCVFIFKSCIYGGFVAFLVLNHQRVTGKQCI